MWVVLLAAVLGGCGGDDGGEPGSGVATGAYFGDVTLSHDEISRSIFAAAELQLSAAGELAGALTTTSPTSTVGELGTLSGQIEASGVAVVSAELTLVFPTLGTYTLKGTLVHAESTRQLSGNLTTRDGDGQVIGSTIVSLMQE
jgi:hypothetical protein